MTSLYLKLLARIRRSERSTLAATIALSGLATLGSSALGQVNGSLSDQPSLSANNLKINAATFDPSDLIAPVNNMGLPVYETANVATLPSSTLLVQPASALQIRPDSTIDLAAPNSDTSAVSSAAIGVETATQALDKPTPITGTIPTLNTSTLPTPSVLTTANPAQDTILANPNALDGAIEFSHAGCSSCGSTTGCSCGITDVGSAFLGQDCGGCDNRYYAGYEALFIERSGDENFTLSQGQTLGAFDFEFGGRYTIGQQFDCLQGAEVVFTGPIDWTRSQLLTAPTGTFNNNFTFPNPATFAPGAVDTYFNSLTHFEFHRAQYLSLEVNKRWWAFDGMSTMIGFRFVEYEEDYQFDAVGQGGGLGFYRFNTDNILVGGHIGADMLFPVSQRLSVGTRTRVGVFANFDESAAFLSNQGNTLINANDTDTDIAGLIETGLVARYRLLPSVVLTGGYESWYLINVATVPGQSPQVLTPGLGSDVETSESIIFHGATAGIEISF